MTAQKTSAVEIENLSPAHLPGAEGDRR